MDVADRAEVLVRLVDGELGGEPLAQQTGTTAFGVVVGTGQRLGGVQEGEGRAGEIGEGVGAAGEKSGSLAELSATPR